MFLIKSAFVGKKALYGNELSSYVKLRGICWPGEELLASQAELC